MKKTLYLILVLSLLLTSLSFSVPAAADYEEEQYLDWFIVGMTVSESKELVPAVKTVTRNGRLLAEDEKVSTGDTVTTANGSYKAVVAGDVTGSGRYSSASYAKIKRFVMGTLAFSDLELYAADINGDGRISSADYAMIKRGVLETYSPKKPENAKKVPVLLYHHIVTDELKEQYFSDNNITIATGEFTRHMQMLKDGGYTVVTVADVVAYVRGEKLLKPGSVVLTFDDGYKSNTYFAAPILREFGNKATVFSIMCFYDGIYEADFDPSRLQHITRRDLYDNSDVFDQQCHTWANHEHLPLQYSYDVYYDLLQSQNCEKQDYFAYPYGDYSDSVIESVQDAGFKAAFSTISRGAVPGDSIWIIPRITITSPMKDSDYLNLLKTQTN